MDNSLKWPRFNKVGDNKRCSVKVRRGVRSSQSWSLGRLWADSIKGHFKGHFNFHIKYPFANLAWPAL